MRIAHIDTERTWRGGEAQVFSLIQGLNAKGHYNLGVVRRGSELGRRLQGVTPLMEINPFGEWDFITAHFLNRRLKAEKIDVVHAHTAHGAALAAIATLGAQIPIVATRRVDFHLAKNIFSRWKYKRAARIVAISDGVKKILLEDGVPARKISVVPSGVDFKCYEEVRRLSKSEMGVSPGSLVVGQVAALAPHKDQNNLLEAAALVRREVPTVEFVIVGEGDLRFFLEKKAQALGLENVVHFLGFQDRPLDCLAAFDVFCLSSKEEGLGTSLLDAMALKIPVVATRVGGIPELIQNGVTGYTAPGSNPQALADMLMACIFAKDHNRAMIAQAAKKAKEFDISHTINGMESIYVQLSTDLST